MTIPWFHGSEAHFEAFDETFVGSQQGRGSPGFWFSNSERAAGYYGPNVVQCALTLSHPLVVSEAMQEEKQKAPKYWANLARQLGHDAVIIEDICDGDIPSTVVCVFSSNQIENLRWKIWDEDLYERVPVVPSPSRGSSRNRRP